MPKLKMILIIASAVFVSGCASTSKIEKASESKSHFEGAAYEGRDFYIADEIIEGEQYRIFHQASTGFSGTGGIKRSAENRAISFCKEMEKTMITVSEHTAAPPYVFGNFPRIEIIFVCADPKKEAKLIEVTTDKYDRISKIKELLDSGALTEEEFNFEKKKILAE